MPGENNKARAGVVTVAVLCSLAAARVPAQEAGTTGGFESSLGVSQRIVAADDDQGLFSSTGLTLSVSDSTKSQRFFFVGTGAIERSLDGGLSPTGIDQPRLNFGYAYETRETEIAFTLDYAERDVDDSFIDPTTDLLILDDGSRTDLNTGVTVTFGRESPFGGVFDLSRSETTTDGTTDSRLQDAVTERAGLTLSFRIDPRITATVSGDIIDTEAEGDGTDRRTERLGTGLELAVNPILTATAGVSYDRVTVSGGQPDSTSEGFGFDLGLTLLRPRGALTGGLSSRVTENGRRTRLDFGRDLVLPTATLGVSLGLVFEEDDVNPLYALNYAQELPRGQVSVGLQQTFTTDVDGDEAISSLLSLAYDRDLSPIDRIGAAFRVQDTDVLSGDGEDARRSVLDLTYSRLLAQDWALVGGVSFERTRDEEDENQVFVGLEKTFSWRD